MKPGHCSLSPWDVLTGRPESSQSPGNSCLPYTLFSQVPAQGPGSCLRGGQTPTPHDCTEGPQRGLSSSLSSRSRSCILSLGAAAPPCQCGCGGARCSSAGEALSFLLPTGLSLLTICCPIPRAQAKGQGAGGKGPIQMCRDPAGAANHLNSGSLQGEGKRTGREASGGGPGRASQQPPPLMLT